MSIVFNIRNLRLPHVSHAGLIAARWPRCSSAAGASVGWHLYQKLTNNTVVAYFPEANALYPGRQGPNHGCRGWARSTRSNPPATR